MQPSDDAHDAQGTRFDDGDNDAACADAAPLTGRLMPLTASFIFPLLPKLLCYKFESIAAV